jgi:hypothetical protein
MAARRLLIVMLVLLGISILGGTLLPAQRARDRTATTETTEEEPTVRDTIPRGDLLQKKIRVPAKTQLAIPIELGDQLLLAVASKRHDEVEIPKLGLVDAVNPFAPARFDILAIEEGSYPIRLVVADRTVGRIVVRPRSPGSKSLSR